MQHRFIRGRAAARSPSRREVDAAWVDGLKTIRAILDRPVSRLGTRGGAVAGPQLTERLDGTETRHLTLKREGN